MIASLFCLAFPLLLIYAAVHDVSTLWIPNWVSISLAVAFFAAAMAAGMPVSLIGWHLLIAAGVMLVCVVLFYLNVFGGGDAKVISAASLWIGTSAMLPFVFWMALAGGVLGIAMLILRRMKIKTTKEWLQRLISPERGAPYAVAIAAGALVAAPASPLLAAGLSGFGV